MLELLNYRNYLAARILGTIFIDLAYTGVYDPRRKCSWQVLAPWYINILFLWIPYPYEVATEAYIIQIVNYVTTAVWVFVVLVLGITESDVIYSFLNGIYLITHIVSFIVFAFIDDG